MRKEITKPYRKANENDIRVIINWMDKKEYKATTIEKFRIILRTFYKIVYGHNKKIPSAVGWFKFKIDKDKSNKDKSIDLGEFLEEKEIQNLINFASTVQKKVFIACRLIL